MPKLSVIAIRLSFLYLVAGFTIGMLLLINKAVSLDMHIYALLPIHIELLMFGWLINFVIGVAFWMFPRFYKAPARGNVAQNNVGFYLFNTGILVVLIENIFMQNTGLIIAGRIIEASGVVIIMASLWFRVFRPSMPHD